MASETLSSDISSGPRGRVRVEPGAKRVRVYVAGVAIADTVRPLFVWESPFYPQYYLPAADVRRDLLHQTSTLTHSPSRGDAVHFTVRVDGDERRDAAWQYRDSPKPCCVADLVFRYYDCPRLYGRLRNTAEQRNCRRRAT